MTLHAPTRSELLLGSGVLFAWSYLPELARAEGRDPRLLVIVLRGALDGLAAGGPVRRAAWHWMDSRRLRQSATRIGRRCAARRGLAAPRQDCRSTLSSHSIRPCPT